MIEVYVYSIGIKHQHIHNIHPYAKSFIFSTRDGGSEPSGRTRLSRIGRRMHKAFFGYIFGVSGICCGRIDGGGGAYGTTLVDLFLGVTAGESDKISEGGTGIGI